MWEGLQSGENDDNKHRKGVTVVAQRQGDEGLTKTEIWMGFVCVCVQIYLFICVYIHNIFMYLHAYVFCVDCAYICMGVYKILWTGKI